jgi:hypothetical protein
MRAPKQKRFTKCRRQATKQEHEQQQQPRRIPLAEGAGGRRKLETDGADAEEKARKTKEKTTKEANGRPRTT